MSRRPLSVCLLITAAALCAAPALAGDFVLWDDDVLVRARKVVTPHASHLTLSILAAETPTQPLYDEVVPFTLDGYSDTDPSIAVLPGKDINDRWLAMAWVRHDPSHGVADIAIEWMHVPTWLTPDRIDWVTSTPYEEEAPKLVLDSQGNQHLLYKRGDSGHLIYHARNARGTLNYVMNLSEDHLQGVGVVSKGYDMAMLSSGERIIVAALDDDTGRVAVLEAGDPPVGGDTLPVPLFADPWVLTSNGGDYAFGQGDVPPAAQVRVIGGVPLVTWQLHDPDLRQDTLHYRFRLEDGTWSRWARLALDDEFQRADAIEAITGFIHSHTVIDPQIDGDLLPPRPGYHIPGIEPAGSDRTGQRVR